MRKYLKHFELTEDFVRNSVYKCLNHNRWKRRDTSYLFAEYWIELNGQADIHKKAKELRTMAYEDTSILFPLVDYISSEIFKEIVGRKISLPKIEYQTRKDRSNGKYREIGISSMKQQLYDYITVDICYELFMKRIGIYQCASIKGRGQIYGKRMLEKWVNKKPKKCKWLLQCDIKKYYPSVDKNVLKRLLLRDIGNEDALYLLFTLIDTYKCGLCIGSYLSQFLANYLLSFAYRYIDEHCYKYRRGKKKKLFYKKLFYMDDIFICGSNKKDIIDTYEMLKSYIENELHLSIKRNAKVYRLNSHPIDMMGFKISQNHTTVRKRIFERANRKYIKFNKGVFMTPRDARICVSYYGYFKHSNSCKYIKKVKLLKTLERAKGVISDTHNK